MTDISAIGPKEFIKLIRIAKGKMRYWFISCCVGTDKPAASRGNRGTC